MKVVCIKWMDSCSGDCYWSPLADFRPFITEPITYGFVIYEDDVVISVAQSYAKGTEEVPAQINGIINIPKAAILELVELQSD